MYPDFDGTQLCAQVDPEIWFPEGALLLANKFAMRICEECHFKDACLQYGLENDVDGIWGGTTNPQRKVIRKTQGIVAKPMAWTFSTTPQAIKARERRAKQKELREEENE